MIPVVPGDDLHPEGAKQHEPGVPVPLDHRPLFMNMQRRSLQATKKKMAALNGLTRPWARFGQTMSTLRLRSATRSRR
jgi:hypothetical protein